MISQLVVYLKTPLDGDDLLPSLINDEIGPPLADAEQSVRRIQWTIVSNVPEYCQQGESNLFVARVQFDIFGEDQGACDLIERTLRKKLRVPKRFACCDGNGEWITIGSIFKDGDSSEFSPVTQESLRHVDYLITYSEGVA